MFIYIGGELGQDKQHLDLLGNLKLKLFEALEMCCQFCKGGGRMVAILNVGINYCFEFHVNGGDGWLGVLHLQHIPNVLSYVHVTILVGNVAFHP